MALGLLFGSLPGPWLTLALPAAGAFALHDRRTGVRVVAAGIVGVVAAMMVGSVAGVALLGVAALALAGAAWTAIRRSLDLSTLAGPALGAGAAGLATAAGIVPGALASWESGLRQGIAESGAEALETYRSLGMDPATLETLEAAASASAEWIARLWPGWLLVTLWLGAWLGYRLLAAWGRPRPEIAGSLEGDPAFQRFRLGEAAIWPLIVGLAGLWFPEPFRRWAANLVLVSGALYGFQGLAVAIWGLDRRGVGRWWRLAIGGAGMVIVAPAMVGSAVALGLADHWIGWRERDESEDTR